MAIAINKIKGSSFLALIKKPITIIDNNPNSLSGI